MEKAKKYLYSDKVQINKEARDGKFNDSFGQGVFTFVTTTSDRINKALEIAYLEGEISANITYDKLPVKFRLEHFEKLVKKLDKLLSEKDI
jgi:hypothetical protein